MQNYSIFLLYNKLKPTCTTYRVRYNGSYQTIVTSITKSSGLSQAFTYTVLPCGTEFTRANVEQPFSVTKCPPRTRERVNSPSWTIGANRTSLP